MLRRTAELALCLAVAGCGLVGPPKTGPHGLSSYDGELRRLTTLGRFEQAVVLAEEQAGEAGDELLAALNLAIVEHYAGRYEESNEHLQAAELEVEERFTKSVSRAALSLLTNDRALAWLPSSSERLMIHVYGALNYLALEEPDEAAVEARRLARLLDRLSDEGVEGLGPEKRRLYRTLRYFTGAVFEQAGERNDADVAYRLAGVDPAAEPKGGVVVLVESGFVAHRVENAVHLLVGADELDDLRHGSEERRLRFARCFSHRRLEGPMNGWNAADDDWCDGVRYSRDRKKKEDDDVSYLMRVAWPSMARPHASAPLGPVRAFSGSTRSPRLTAARDATAVDAGTDAREPVTLAAEPLAAGPLAAGSVPPDSAAPPGEEAPGDAAFSADLSGAVIHEFNAQAPEMLVKSVARAAVKYAVVQAIEDGARKEDETLADVAAIVGNVFTALTERADTRSWTLLPARIEVVRLHLPPGSHDVKVAAVGSPGRTMEVGTVSVRPGGLVVRSVRSWP